MYRSVFRTNRLSHLIYTRLWQPLRRVYNCSSCPNMARNVTFGLTSKGRKTAIYKNYEYVKHRDYANGETQWRCRLYQSWNCQARLKTSGDKYIGLTDPDHNHESNTVNISARQAVSVMKDKVTELSATSSAAIGAVSATQNNDVLMALPKRASLKRTLQRTRKAAQRIGDFDLPVAPTDTSFVIPQQFADMVLFDSGPATVEGEDRLIMLGSTELLDGLARSKLWLADGTFKVCPSLFFQLYTIHFELSPGIVPAAVYCLV